MGKYDLAVFDVDGTLLDTTEGVLSSVKYTITQFGLPMPEESILKTFIGPPIQDSFARVFDLKGPILQEIATVFRNQYKDVDLLKAVAYPGIYETMEKLVAGGVKIAAATYKRQDYADKILRHFGFGRYSDVLYGADHENKLKKSDIIALAIQDSGITDFGRVVMVGDSAHDAVGAEKLGVDFIGVTYGFDFTTPEQVKKFPCVGVAQSPLEIYSCICE